MTASRLCPSCGSLMSEHRMPADDGVILARFVCDGCDELFVESAPVATALDEPEAA